MQMSSIQRSAALALLMSAFAVPGAYAEEAKKPDVNEDRKSGNKNENKSDDGKDGERKPSDLINEKIRGIRIGLSGSLDMKFWRPGIVGSAERAVKFSGQNLHSYAYDLGVYDSKNERIWGIGKKQPFSGGAKKGDVISSKTQDAKMDELVATLKPIKGVMQFIPEAGEVLGFGKNKFMDFLASLDSSFNITNLSGVAKGIREAKLLKFNAIIEKRGNTTYIMNDSQSVYGINKGEKYNFRTEVRDWEVSFDVAKLLDAGKNDDFELRVGGYWTSWTRPSEAYSLNIYYGNTAYPLIQEARYYSKGIMLKIGDKTPGKDFDYHITARYGIDNDIETPLSTVFKFDNLRYYDVGATVGYNKDLADYGVSNGVASIHATASYRLFYEEVRDSYNSKSAKGMTPRDGELFGGIMARFTARF